MDGYGITLSAGLCWIGGEGGFLNWRIIRENLALGMLRVFGAVDFSSFEMGLGMPV